MALLDCRLLEECLGALSHRHHVMYLTCLELFRQEPGLTSTRKLATRARLDQAVVVPALRELERLLLIRCERSSKGTWVEVLAASPEALLALRQRSLQRGGAAARASPLGLWLVAKAEAALRARGQLPPLPHPAPLPPLPPGEEDWPDDIWG